MWEQRGRGNRVETDIAGLEAMYGEEGGGWVEGSERNYFHVSPALWYIVSVCFSIIHRVGVGRHSRRDVRLIFHNTEDFWNGVYLVHSCKDTNT